MVYLEPRRTTPVLYLQIRQGVKGINAQKMPARAWLLLNEAVSCFRNAEYEACITTLISCAEVWLRREFRDRDLPLSRHLRGLIDKAVPTILSVEDAKKLHQLREVRNKLVHSDVGWLERIIKSMTEIKTGRKFRPSEIFPGDKGKGISVFLRIPLDALVHLTNVVNLFRERYGSENPDERYSYFTGHILQVGEKRFKVNEHF